MNVKPEGRPSSSNFVLFPLGGKRFAIPAEQVTELAKPDVLQTFPHTTRLLSGVLLRRDKIIPVLDVAEVVIGPDAPPRKFYLIATRTLANGEELTAIAVTGECELKKWEMMAAKIALPKYVVGILDLPGETIEVLDLNKLAMTEAA
jgi:chemotaxis signal transduction protein